MQRFATPALVLGLVSWAAAIWLNAYRPSWRAAWPAAAIVGGLLVLFALYASFARLSGVWGRRSTRHGLNALVMVVLILGVIGLVEAVSYRHNWRVDLTENKRNSLAPQTIKVLQELYRPDLWRNTFKSIPPILFGAGYGLCDSSPHLGYMVKGDGLTAEYLKSLTIDK